MKESVSYNHLIPEIKKWPVAKMSAERDDFINQVVEETFQDLKLKPQTSEELMAKALFQEEQRIKYNPWKVDPPNEKQFWNRVKKQLGALAEVDNGGKAEQSDELFHRIIKRFATEIVGHFKVKTFLFARKFLTIFFKILFDKFFTGPIAFWGSRATLKKRIKTYGDIEHIRELWDKGVLILVPTHSSNLDSIFLGYTLDLKVGLPSFSYGAGLNLFNSEIMAYFMNRLGAYKVDRRKKNLIYLETLKTMSRLSILSGVNNLFFPGGTRSRSGKLEDQLKLGLLSTTVEAQRRLYQNGSDLKVFVVPVVISYPNVLEAHSLIEQHLRKTGRSKYIPKKGVAPLFRWIWFGVWDIWTKRTEAHLSFGEPMDVMGNFIDRDGWSLDSLDKKIQLKEYFQSGDGRINKDVQRESVYTQKLAESISIDYKKTNVVLPGHVISYAYFRLLVEKNSEIDFYDLLNLKPQETKVSERELLNRVESIIQKLGQMEQNGELRLSFDLGITPKDILLTGIREIANYHWKHPIKRNKSQEIYSENVKLLYFYHNRLDSYPVLSK